MYDSKDAYLENITNAIDDERVVAAFAKVDRSLFVDDEYRQFAYEDRPLPIGQGQTISQPSLVAKMLELLKLTGKERVLEIGTGSGFETALLSLLTHDVYTVERIPELSFEAEKRLQDLKITNVHFAVANGSIGWKSEAPYDRIIVTAAGPKVPDELIEQLVKSGILVLPVGDWSGNQTLVAGRKVDGELKIYWISPVNFVPLIGKSGY